jgi:hypothetical protein
MPSESPLREESRLADDSLVVLDDRLWGVRVDHDVDLADTTGGDLFEHYLSSCLEVLYDPVLGSHVLREDTDPLGGRVLIHKEGVDALSILSWEVSIIYLIKFGSLSPHGVDTVLVEQASVHLSLA